MQEHEPFTSWTAGEKNKVNSSLTTLLSDMVYGKDPSEKLNSTEYVKKTGSYYNNTYQKAN